MLPILSKSWRINTLTVLYSDNSVNDLVLVEVMTGLSSLLRAHNAMTMNIVAVVVGDVVAVEVMIFPLPLMNAKE